MLANVSDRLSFSTFLFFQRENIEMYLKGCEAYGLKTQDLFQVLHPKL